MRHTDGLILEALKIARRPQTIEEVAQATGREASTIRKALVYLAAWNVVDAISGGRGRGNIARFRLHSDTPLPPSEGKVIEIKPKSVSAQARTLMLDIMARHAWTEAEIVRATGLPRSTVQGGLRKLVKMGLVNKTPGSKGRGNAASYRIGC